MLQDIYSCNRIITIYLRSQELDLSNGNSITARATQGMFSLPGVRKAASNTAMSSSETMAGSGNVLRQTPLVPPFIQGADVMGASS